jgi:anti-anti-sigma factor
MSDNIITISCGLDVGNTQTLECEIKDIEDSGAKDIILSLKNTDYIDSYGVGLLSRLNKSVGIKKLVDITDMVHEVLEVIGLSGIISF